MRLLRRSVVLLAVPVLAAATPVPPAEPPTDNPAITNKDALSRNENINHVRLAAEKELPNDFAGISVEDDSVEELGTIVIHVKPQLPPAQREKLKDALQTSLPVRFEEQPFSLRDLRELKTRIRNDLPYFRENGVNIQGYGVDEVGNKVEVGVAPEHFQHALTLLGQRYPDSPISIVRQAPFRQVAGGPYDSPGLFKAGVKVESSTLGCTSGFGVRDWSNVGYFVTAGHCGTVNDAVKHADSRVGNIILRQNGGDADISLVKLDVGNSSGWMVRGYNWLLPIQNFSSAPQGELICSLGIYSGFRCGAVVSRDYAYEGDFGVDFDHMHCAQFDSVEGDSGGPVFGGATGYGITAASGGGKTCYTPMDRVVQKWNLKPFINTGPKKFTIDHSGKCLDGDNAAGGSNGHKVQQWDCLPYTQTNQAFYLQPSSLPGALGFTDTWQFRMGHNARCVDFDIAGNTGNGGKVQQWDCNGQLNQRFDFIRGPGLSVSLRAYSNSRCIDIDIAIAPLANGTKAQQWDCNGFSNQRYTLQQS